VIDFEGPVPLYVQVADELAAKIASGELAPNRPIPSESRISQEYGVGRSTARKAINVLKSRGLVVGVVGRGTYVR
jgi:GntR family transcriptional regulator